MISLKVLTNGLQTYTGLINAGYEFFNPTTSRSSINIFCDLSKLALASCVFVRAKMSRILMWNFYGQNLESLLQNQIQSQGWNFWLPYWYKALYAGKGGYASQPCILLEEFDHSAYLDPFKRRLEYLWCREICQTKKKVIGTMFLGKWTQLTSLQGGSVVNFLVQREWRRLA